MLQNQNKEVKIMEDIEWKRDETTYIIFACKKCKQFMYVKQTQKTKKCLRCRRSHKVPDISNTGEIVSGITQAVEMVKEKQHELAIQELGATPKFSAYGDFKLQTSSGPKKKAEEPSRVDNEYLPQFKKMLSELSDLYTKIPYFIFEILAENYNIPDSELKILIHSFQKKGVIIRNKQDYMYRIKLNDFHF